MFNWRTSGLVDPTNPRLSNSVTIDCSIQKSFHIDGRRRTKCSGGRGELPPKGRFARPGDREGDRTGGKAELAEALHYGGAGRVRVGYRLANPDANNHKGSKVGLIR
jgi:hypothetical protein